MQTLISNYKQLIENNSKKYIDDYNKLYKSLEDSPAYFQGEVIPFLYQPLFFKEADIINFKRLTDNLAVILTKVIETYLLEESFRDEFNFSSRLEELIMIDPGYNDSFPMARFDIFYHPDGKSKFCEINTDGSSGMVKTNTLEKHFLDSEIIKDLSDKYKFDYFELVNQWVDKLLEIYTQFSDRDDKPNIAIMDFRECAMISEFKHFKKIIKKRGYSVEIVDPRELSYKQGVLYSNNDFKIDLIYRRAVTTDIMSNYDQIQPLIQAYKNKDVCLIGSFRSQIIHDKLIFSILHSDICEEILTEREINFIKEHIPYTAEVNKLNEKKFNDLLNNHTKYVLKPRDSYGAKGVLIGKDYNLAEWRNKLDRIELDNYLVQEFCQTPKKDMTKFAGDKVRIDKYKYILGLFLYSKEFCGIYTRVGQENVIASVTGCYTVPNFLTSTKY